jgi:RHS repeat-associated protein
MTNVTWLTTCYEYDDLGRQIATWQTNRSAKVGLPVTRTRYDALGRVVARVDQLGNTTTTSYSKDGRSVLVQNPNTSTRVTTRSTNGDTLSITGSAVTPEFHTYGISPDGTRWYKTEQGETANSPRFTKRYENMLGQGVKEERSGFKGAVLATAHSYDSLGRLVSTVADYEPTIEYTYDTFGNRFSTIRSVEASVPARPSEWRKTETLSSFVLFDSTIWLTQTNIVSCSDFAIAPLITSSSRQLTGLTQTLPARSRTTDIRGNVTENELLVDLPFVTSQQIVPYATNKHQTTSRYGIELQTVSVSAVTNTIAYDYLGRQISNTDGRGNSTRVEYNAFGQRVASIDALGNRTTYTYDQFGNLTSIINPLGNAIVYEYDLRGLKTYEGGATYPVRYTYDVFGNKTTMMTYRDESKGRDSGDVTTWLYDEASGVMTNKVYADGKGPSYTYTPDGKLSQRTWARGITTDYSYDNWGNLTNTVYSDNTPTISLSYDVLGRQIEARDAAGVTIFLYDSFGSLTNETVIGVAGTNTIERFWDDFGRTAGYSLNPDNPVNSVQVSCTYDTLGHFAAVEFDSHTEPQRRRVEYDYLPDTDLVYGYTSGNFSRSVSYEPHRDLIAAVTNTFSASLISAFDYSNDAAGRRISRLDTFGGAATANTFGYNVRSEVVSALMGTNIYGYAYDPIGNRLTSSHNADTNLYAPNSLNQYTTISNLCLSVPPRDETNPVNPVNTNPCAYDADGNMTADERGWYYVWNGENRMICASNDEVVVTYAYDHRGRMVRKNILRGNAEPQRMGYVWDGWNIIRETFVTRHSSLVTDNVWGLDIDGTLQGAGGVGGLLAVIRSNSSTQKLYLPAYDANGNVSEYVATNGTVAAHYEYSAFGEPVVTSGELAASFTHQFSTKPYCGVTGFSEYQMRKYRAEIGRWMSRDPRKDNGFASSNSALMTMFEDIDTSSLLAAFINNNAIQYIDFLGLRQVGQPIKCNNCLICIDNDRGSGDGNGYKIHWKCGRPRPKTCRGGGSAQWPSGAPSHGTEGIPKNIRKCLDKTRWKLTPITVEVPTEENETCCKKSTFEYLTPVAKVGGACVAIYATYKVVKICGGGTIGFLVGGPPGAISGVLFCLGTP